MGENQSHGNDRQECDQPQQDAAAHRQLRRNSVDDLQGANDGELTSSADGGQLHNRTRHAEAHQQKNMAYVEIRQMRAIANSSLAMRALVEEITVITRGIVVLNTKALTFYALFDFSKRAFIQRLSGQERPIR